MKSKTRILMMACTTIMLCVSLIVAGTYALFTDSLTVKNHLEAGTLAVKLERVGLTWTELDSTTGYLTPNNNTDVVDFTTATTENIFGIGDDVKIVPGCFYEATLKLSVSGSVALDYTVEIVLEGASNSLAEQLKVVVDSVDKGTISNGKTEVSSGVMAKNDTAKTFVVRIEFVNNDTNNAAQAKEVSFDLVVKAVQRNTTP